MPAVVKPIVENNDGPVLQQRRDEVEDPFRGLVEVAVDVDDRRSLQVQSLSQGQRDYRPAANRKQRAARKQKPRGFWPQGF